jgi:hypothetical protein
MSDVRLTATNPVDSTVVPVACNEKGELLTVPPVIEQIDNDVTINGTLFTQDVKVLNAISNGRLYVDGTNVKLSNETTGLNGGQLEIKADKNALRSPAVNNSVGLQTYVNVPDGTTLTAHDGFRAAPSSLGSSAITNLNFFSALKSNSLSGGTIKGFSAANSLTDGTNASYGFWSDIGTGSTGNNYNFYAAGSGQNFFQGSVGIGRNNPSTKLDVNGEVTVVSRNKSYVLVEQGGLCHMVESATAEANDSYPVENVTETTEDNYPNLRDVFKELDLIEQALNTVMDKLRLNPPAGWPVWDGSDES